MEKAIAVALLLLATVIEAVSYVCDLLRQVTVQYRQDRGAMLPLRVHTVVVSVQHDEVVSLEEMRASLKELVVRAVVPPAYLDQDTVYHLQPSGRFVIGGPQVTLVCMRAYGCIPTAVSQPVVTQRALLYLMSARHSSIHTHVHPLTAVSTMQGNSQPVRSSLVGCLAQGHLDARRSRGSSNLPVANQAFKLPLKDCLPQNCI